MELLQLTVGFLLALLAINLWTRIKFRLGFRPLLLDEDQAHIVAKNWAWNMVAHAKELPGLFGSDGSARDKDRVMTELYCFAREVIRSYTAQLELPAFDATPDPPGIREQRAAVGEAR